MTTPTTKQIGNVSNVAGASLNDALNTLMAAGAPAVIVAAVAAGLIEGGGVTITYNSLGGTITLALTNGDKGDITVSGSGGTWTIDANVVGNTKLAQMGTGTVKARLTAGTGNPEDVTIAQLQAAMAVATGSTKGLVPGPGTPTGKFLKDDLTWATPPAGAGEANTASNVGSGSGLYKTKSGINLQFKSLVAGPGTRLTANTDDVTVTCDIPQNSQSAAYGIVLADAFKHILHPSADTTARTFTIPANASVAFPIGTAITFVNQNGAGSLSIAITTDTMRLAGLGTTGTRTLAANGLCTALKITATEWIIAGTGLT